ncbi:hypothetical protein JW756_04770 [Candidatus Woesearchaeota archaeon]|nr:hypothetical protein [Candidatus Woesearchaeota archaeon]
MALKPQRKIKCSEWPEYLKNLSFLGNIELLIEYYTNHPERILNKNESDREILAAKKALIKTQYSHLTGVAGEKVPVDFAHNPRINEAFRKMFTDKKNLFDYLQPLRETAGVYASPVSRYEEKVLVASQKPQAELTDLIAAERIAGIRKNREKKRNRFHLAPPSPEEMAYQRLENKLHEIIEKILETCPEKEIAATTKVFGQYTMHTYRSYADRDFYRRHGIKKDQA